MSGEQQPTTQAWIYLGRRALAGGGLGDARLPADRQPDELVLFKAAAGRNVPGGRYEVRCAETATGLSLHGCPRLLENSGHELTAEWELADRVAYLDDEARRAEQRALRYGPERLGTPTLAELKQRHHAAPAPRRAALLATLLRYLGA